MELVASSAVEIPNQYYGHKCAPLLLGNHLVCMLGDMTTVGVVDLKNLDNNGLEGHASRVTALCASITGGNFLCSCSPDKVILWDVATACKDNAAPPPQVVAGVDLGPVEHCALAAHNKWLALCQGRQIMIVSLKFSGNEHNVSNLSSVTEHAVLSCGSSVFRSSAFSPTLDDILVGIEDNAFKVWDVASSSLVHQSASLGVRFQLTCSAFGAVSGRLVLGSNFGQAHVFCVNPASTCKLVSVDAARVFSRAVDTDVECMETGCMVLSAQLLDCDLHLTPPQGQHMFQQDCTTLNSILAPGSRLVLYCNVGIAVFDCKTTDCLAQLLFSAPTLHSGVTLGLADSIVIGCQPTAGLDCVVRDMLRRVRIIRLELKPHTLQGATIGVAVVPTVAVRMDSPLTRVYRHAPVCAYATQGGRGGKAVRSSGYGKPPTQQAMFSPNINHPRKSSRASSKKVAKLVAAVSSVSEAGCESMHRCSGPPTKLIEKVSLCDTTGTTISLAASGNGKSLACSWDTSVCVLAFKKFDLDKSVNFGGHDGTINSLHFNLDSKWLISSSKDGTANVWDWKNKKCVLNIDPASKLARSNGKSRQQLAWASGDSLLDARFIYMDQFVLLSSGNQLVLCSHSLHEPDCRLHKWRSVHVATLPAQHITCSSAANQLHSYIVLAGCSNKSVVAYDLNAQQACAQLCDVHARPPHRLRQMGGSHAAVNMYDLFATAAVADGAKLWDLRAARCVASFHRHWGRSYATGLDVSPCGKFLAVGSEDRATYIYDTRKASDHVTKLSGLGDVVVEVAFNPSLSAVMASASLGGAVAKYSS